MLEPYKGRVYDPCCGSGGMFVSSEKFVEAHGGRIGDIAIYGQESNPTTWRLAKMTLAIRGIEADLGKENADSFHRDLHKDLKADFILANGSMSSNTSGEGDIRKAIVEADLVDCMVALPGQLFYATQIPVCLWFLARNKNDGKRRNRKGQTLFIDARKLGAMMPDSRQTPSRPRIWNLYVVPSPMLGMNSSQIPVDPSDRIGWPEPSHQLKSPQTRTPWALGAHTANDTPVTRPRAVWYVRVCAPRTCHSCSWRPSPIRCRSMSPRVGRNR